MNGIDIIIYENEQIRYSEKSSVFFMKSNEKMQSPTLNGLKEKYNNEFNKMMKKFKKIPVFVNAYSKYIEVTLIYVNNDIAKIEYDNGETYKCNLSNVYLRTEKNINLINEIKKLSIEYSVIYNEIQLKLSQMEKYQKAEEI